MSNDGTAYELKRALESHMAYGMTLQDIVFEGEGYRVFLQSEKTYDGMHFDYNVPVSRQSVEGDPRQVARLLSADAKDTMDASLKVGDTQQR